jgi:hypothetical protein
MYFISNIDHEIHNTHDVHCLVKDGVVEVLQRDEAGDQIIDTCTAYESIVYLLKAMNS